MFSVDPTGARSRVSGRATADYNGSLGRRRLIRPASNFGSTDMIRFLALGAGLAALLCAAPSPAAPEATVQNPLLAPWTGPHGGVPPFDRVKVEHFKPALEAAMAEQLAEIDKIAGDPAPPTFENTFAALER